MPRRTLLLVDDHDGFRRMARRMLEAGGFDVVAEATTGAQALREAETVRPDLVLLDILLPDLDGFAVAEQLVLLPNPPVVVLISSRPREDLRSRLDTPATFRFLAKDELSAGRLAALAPEWR